MLDTNILSTLMSAAPAEEVAAWVLRQPSEQLFTAAVCQAEILSGIAVLPTGRRRTELEAAAQAMFADDFEGRVLPFDTNAAPPTRTSSRPGGEQGGHPPRSIS